MDDRCRKIIQSVTNRSKTFGFSSSIKEIMEEFVSGGAAKSELHFFKITPAALERKGKK